MRPYYSRSQLEDLLGTPVPEQTGELVPIRAFDDKGRELPSYTGHLLWDCSKVFDALDRIELTGLHLDKAERDGVVNAVSLLRSTFGCLAFEEENDKWFVAFLCPRHRHLIQPNS
jgi:hypothetical protein